MIIIEELSIHWLGVQYHTVNTRVGIPKKVLLSQLWQLWNVNTKVNQLMKIMYPSGVTEGEFIYITRTGNNNNRNI